MPGTSDHPPLATLLANSQVFYMKLRNYHWNVKGDKFFELHVKFEELYTEWAQHIDDIAERMLTRGERPPSSLHETLALAELKEDLGSPDGTQMVRNLADDLTTLSKSMVKLAETYEEENDRGTADLLDDIRNAQEKTVSMLRSWLGD